MLRNFLWYHEDHIKKARVFLRRTRLLPDICGALFFTLLFSNIYKMYWLQAIGFGVMAYGFLTLWCMMLLFTSFKWFTRTNNIYFRRTGHIKCIQTFGKEEGESFGMLQP
jgi:beta-carotene 3-hydroxylase